MSIENASDWPAAALVIAAGTLTPGPNNFIVMRSAARGGLRAALPAIAAILLGSTALLALASGGGAAVFAAWPMLRRAVCIVGCLYLCWLGIALMRSTRAAIEPTVQRGAFGLFAFQLCNPKGWALALTLIAAQTTRQTIDLFAQLAALYAGIAALGLVLWAALGLVLAQFAPRPVQRRWLDRVFGASLIAGALLLLLLP